MWSSADGLGKQFRPRSDPTIFWVRSGLNVLFTLIVFPKKVDFEKKKNQQTTKKHYIVMLFCPLLAFLITFFSAERKT